MSRQMVLNRKGNTVGFIDTDYDGTQNAMSSVGALLATFDPRTNQTFDATGRNLGDGNALAGMMRKLK